MKIFEFEILEYFKLQNSQFGLVGIMKPEDFPIVTQDYNMRLITKSGKERVFRDIGEEIIVRSDPGRNNKRAFRTTDDIEQYLKDLVNDPVKVVGYKVDE